MPSGSSSSSAGTGPPPPGYGGDSRPALNVETGDTAGVTSTPPQPSGRTPPPTASTTASHGRRNHPHGPRPRPKRCYSVEAVWDTPRDRADRAERGEAQHLPPMAEGDGSPEQPMRPLISPPDVASPVQSTTSAPAPAPAVPTPTVPARAATGASQPTSPTLGRAPTRHRSHTVSVTMPPWAQRAAQRAAERRYQRMADNDAEHEGGSTVSVRLSDDDYGSSKQSSTRGGAGGAKPRTRARSRSVANETGELHDDAVGLLDCVDGEVSTLNTLQNVTNGIMFPHLPMLWSRRPTIVLPVTPDDQSVSSDDGRDATADADLGEEGLLPQPATAKRTRRRRSSSVSSRFLHKEEAPRMPATYSPVSEEPDEGGKGVGAHHEVLPLETLGKERKKTSADEEEDESDVESEDDKIEHELDHHLRKVLKRQQRKEKVKRGLKGLWAFVKTPMGFITAVYGFLVAFWGAAIVLFLLGWIPTSSKDTQDKWVEISSQVENGLFTITGVGLIPWRAVDTYRMSVIWTLRRRFERRCVKRGIPPLQDPDDLPDPAKEPGYEDILTEKELARLKDQQQKFAKSQTWYLPHATATHRAFPMKYALWNTILMDGNSFFQCILCGCMWGMNRHQRPAWTTGSLIPLSFLCGIGAGVLIWQGGARTKKKDVEEKLRKALNVDADDSGSEDKPRRRATVSARPARTVSVPKQPERAATIDVLPEMPEGDFKLDRGAILGRVDESTEAVNHTAEPVHDHELSSADGKDTKYSDDADVPLPELHR